MPHTARNFPNLADPMPSSDNSNAPAAGIIGGIPKGPQLRLTSTETSCSLCGFSRVRLGRTAWTPGRVSRQPLTKAQKFWLPRSKSSGYKYRSPNNQRPSTNGPACHSDRALEGAVVQRMPCVSSAAVCQQLPGGVSFFWQWCCQRTESQAGQSVQPTRS